jgi:hypothetical protein
MSTSKISPYSLLSLSVEEALAARHLLSVRFERARGCRMVNDRKSCSQVSCLCQLSLQIRSGDLCDASDASAPANDSIGREAAACVDFLLSQRHHERIIYTFGGASQVAPAGDAHHLTRLHSPTTKSGFF